jgi:MtN3 and saliva related transmembrane protein
MIVMGSLGHSMFLMQTHKIFMSGTAHDVSLPGFIVVFFALVCWLFYGILIKDKVLVIVNIVGALCAVTTVIAIIVAEA